MAAVAASIGGGSILGKSCFNNKVDEDVTSFFLLLLLLVVVVAGVGASSSACGCL